MTKLTEILARVLGIGPIRYDIRYKPVGAPNQVQVEGNSFIFINQGTSNIIIDDVLILVPNQSFSIPGELFEYMDRTFRVNFSTGSGSLLIVIKFYH